MLTGTPLRSESDRETPVCREFDGVICFGGADWWYHNRAHYDLQMMRHLQQEVPVLYVNSIGIRIPRISEGGAFVRRIRRKLRSFTRGFVRLAPGFAVASPIAIPGRIGSLLSGRLLSLQVRWAAKRMGISRPLVWIECPPAARVLESLHPVAVVYQRTDRYEEFPDADRAAIRGYDRALKQRADVTLFCSSLLLQQEEAECRHALYVDHGVDYTRFAVAGQDAASEPADLRDVPHPRVGFVGGIDAHTFDRELFCSVAERLPDCQFILVGSCSLPPGWCKLPNVRMLGPRPYEAVPGYMAACDVLIMPWNQNEWIKACNPVKLKEYLAVGRPVVSSDFAELSRYEGYVQRATGPAAFAEGIRQALSCPPAASVLRQRVCEETWQSKCENVLRDLAQRGIASRQPMGLG